MRTKWWVVGLVLIGLVAAQLVSANAKEGITPTPWWCDFYSFSSYLNGELVPAGALIEAYADGVLCGKTIARQGEWGIMHVYGDDRSSPDVDEGAVAGDRITFYINGRLATVMKGDPIWRWRELHQLELAAFTPVKVYLPKIGR